MYRRRTPGAKRDAQKRWALPERVFFACGACHILTYAFLTRYGDAGYEALWLKPDSSFTGNHIVAVRAGTVFDYHGFSDWERYREHTWRRAAQWWPGWNATLVRLPASVLVSEEQSKTYDGLWLREPGQFLYDALPRAYRYLDRFPPPD